MKNILGVIGSPRKKGNTEKMVSRILEGAHDLGAHTETIRLGDLKILECDGCHACWKGKGVCSKKDDMAALYPKIAQNDAIVFGTPVYWYGPTAIMKCFIDRLVYFNCPAHREQIRNKAAVIAIPFEDKTYATADLLVSFFERSLGYLEMRLIDRILAPGVTRRGEVSGRKQIMATCYKVGGTLASSGDIPLKPLEVSTSLTHTTDRHGSYFKGRRMARHGPASPFHMESGRHSRSYSPGGTSARAQPSRM